jgi:hypothetical protein
MRSVVELSSLLRCSQLCLSLLRRSRLITALSLELLLLRTNLYNIYIHVVFTRQISRVAIRTEAVGQHFIRIRLPLRRLIGNLWSCGFRGARRDYKMPLDGLLS